MNKSIFDLNNLEVKEVEIAPDKITLIRYNPKTTDCGELANALFASKLPKGKHTFIIPDDVEISQMSPEKEICQKKE